MSTLRPDRSTLEQFWRAMVAPGDVHEVRIPRSRSGPARLFGTVSGYFTIAEAFAQAVAAITGADAEGVYLTLNPTLSALRARADNRLENRAKATTTDDQIRTRRHLLIDVDPVRHAGIAATDAEVKAALTTRDAIAAYFDDCGWPAPVYAAMTGSGGALVYRVDLVNDDASQALVAGCLTALAGAFDSTEVTIDQSVANAARLCKVVGSVGAKGDHCPDLGRVWRLTEGIFTPDPSPVPRALLEALAAQVPAAPASTPPSGQSTRQWHLPDILAKQGITYTTKPARYGTTYQLDRCLTSSDHLDGAAIVEMRSGALAYHCFHDRCRGSGWRDVRGVLGLDEGRGLGGRAEAGRSPGAGTGPELGWRRLDQVQREHIHWLWRGYIPRGKLVILEGDAGQGKSTITLDLTARITSHRAMPDGTPNGLDAPADVLLLSAEDGPGDTIQPKVQDMGGDLARVHLWDGIPDGENLRPPALPADLAHLEAKIAATGAAVVIVDPIMAYLGANIDTYKDHHTRRALAPLAALAERLDVTIIIVRHLTKGAATDNPLHRGGGSVAFGAAARCVLVVAPDPDDPEHTQRVLAVTKTNLAKPPASLAYTLAGAEDQPAVVQWQGASQHTARTLLALNPDEKADTRLALDEAAAFLEQTLRGGRRLASEVLAEAEQLHIAEKTLRRAAKQIGVIAQREGFGEAGRWYWAAPAGDPPPAPIGEPAYPADGHLWANRPAAPPKTPMKSWIPP
jgi:RecA-family ATPase